MSSTRDLLFATKIKEIERDANIGSDGLDRLENPDIVPFPSPGAQQVIETTRSAISLVTDVIYKPNGNVASEERSQSPACLYIGGKGHVAVSDVPNIRSHSSKVFKNVPDGSFLPVVTNNVIWTTFKYLALDTELKDLVSSWTNVLGASSANGITKLDGTWKREFSGNFENLANVKLEMSATTLGYTSGPVALRLTEGLNPNYDTVSNKNFNLDFVEAGDKITVATTESDAVSASFDIVITDAVLSTMQGTTATDILAYI